MNSALSIVPATYDMAFLLNKAGVVNHYGYQAEEDGIHFRYQYEDLDAVVAAIESYPVDYLSVLLPRKLAEVSAIRDEKIKAFSFGGMTIEIDSETKVNLNGCVLGLDRNPDVLGINWSLGNGQFVYLDRATMYALADAVFMHVQDCFTAHKAHTDALKAAADIDALQAIDLETGWPE